jgi:hypothetical protein
MTILVDTKQTQVCFPQEQQARVLRQQHQQPQLKLAQHKRSRSKSPERQQAGGAQRRTARPTAVSAATTGPSAASKEATTSDPRHMKGNPVASVPCQSKDTVCRRKEVIICSAAADASTRIDRSDSQLPHLPVHFKNKVHATKS